MKKRLFFAAMLLLAFGSMKAQDQTSAEIGKNVNTVVVNATGDVTIRQSDQYVVAWDANHKWHANYNMADTAVYLDGTADFDVTLLELNHLTLLSSGDVISAGVLKGKDLSLTVTGTGDVKLDLDYDKVCVRILGTGDVEFGGRCNTLISLVSGTGDLDVRRLQCSDKRDMKTSVPNMPQFKELMSELGKNMQMLSDSVDWEKFEQDMEKWGADMEEWGRKMEKWGDRIERKYGDGREFHYEYNSCRPEPKKEGNKDKRPVKKNLLFDAHWNGFGAGLNMLLGPGSTAGFADDYNFLELRPLQSWVFNFNIADVGIAFDRRHIAGLFTGVGLSWNNYSFNNPVRLVKRDHRLEGEWIDPAVAVVKKSKLGVLYLQVPLMLEVRPTRHFNIAAGVTGGLRIDTWTTIKFLKGDMNKMHNDYYVNPFKLDASLRVGSDFFGFFADYNLLPTFDEAHAPSCHTLSFGFSINF
ncbi:MAG: DUF2807 domain-containing protein [Bacteroidales bacterium]|nr:DUF2807 domain-containing protein [Bacteroidales bacterium]